MVAVRRPSLRNKAFTYIELSVVIFVLALMAALALPSLVGWQRAQLVARFVTDLGNVGVDARERAISTNRTVLLSYSDSERTLTLSNEASGTEDEQPISNIQVPEGVQIARYVQEGEESNASEWQLAFYPDGTSNGGGIEVEVGGGLKSLEVKKVNGASRLLDEALPETTEESWAAGDYEQRA